LYKIGLVSNPKSVAEYSFKVFRGKTKQDIKNLSKSFFDEVLINYFYKDALNIIIEHKKNNRKIILLSNAIENIIKEVSEYLNVEDYICTKLEIENGVYTGKIDGHTTFGENKVKKLETFLAENNLSLQNQESWGYGDHLSDIFVLKLVKYPFVINPNKKMRKIANKNKWSILIFNK
ncbi:MAG: HAD-IB family hydrolase, partial [Candidatus Pacebacteria bacterium]|nr:HAD-IB family hydrolase [Candidatus Paceibacterota bacterium]